MHNKPPEYYKVEFQGRTLDPYRILSLYKIEEPEHQHALKKLLRAGNKPGNELKKEIGEVIWTLNRWLERIDEDEEDKDMSAKTRRKPRELMELQSGETDGY